MSVCMSAVSAGISEVLIKYKGNVWLHKCFYDIHKVMLDNIQYIIGNNIM